MRDFELEESRDGYKILKVVEEGKSYFIGSKYNQKREIEKFIKQAGVLSENDIYIIWGLASIEAVEKLAQKKLKGTKIIILENDEKILKILNANIEIDKIENTTCLCNSNVRRISNYINEENVEFVKQLSFGNYNKIMKNDIIDMYKFVKGVLESYKICRNTRKFFEMDWLKCDIHNSKMIPKSLKLDGFRDEYKDAPAVIVSAGPSLSKNIKYLNEEKVYVISGGRTLKPLLNRGIDPDLLCVIDAGEISYELVEEEINKTKSTLVFSEMTNYKVVKEHRGNKIVAAQTGIIKKMFNYDIESIVKGGSVANSMAYIAGVMGFNPIIFIGQDLGYTDNKGHSDIARYKNNSVDGKEKYFKDGDVYVEDIYGGEIRTSIVLKGFRDAMESIIKMFPYTTFIDATEGGALIKGTEIKKMKDVMSEIKIIKKEGIGKEIFDKELYENLKKYMNDSEANMKKVQKLCVEGKAELEKLKKLYFAKKSIESVNKKLDFIEKEIRWLLKKLDLLNNFFYPFIYKLKNEERFVINKNDNGKEVINKKMALNLEIYSGIIKICDTAIKEVKEAYHNY